MAYKTLIFGVDDMFAQLQPLYNQAVQRGILDIIAYVEIKDDDFIIYNADGKAIGDNWLDVDIAIISSLSRFYERMKFLESQGFPRNRIIDGRVFQIPNLDFPRLLAEGVAHGILETNSLVWENFLPINYPRLYRIKNTCSIISMGQKSYINKAQLEGNGYISSDKFSSIAWNVLFTMGQNGDHNYHNVNNYGMLHLGWAFPQEFLPSQDMCKILIGNDVWIGRGCILKCTNPNKPLIIGDGAVVASDSVVVKNVPPYAIVGGNPAKIIKYRFPPHVIEALQLIKWWDWSIDKIHDNFKYFNDIDKFIALHDKT